MDLNKIMQGIRAAYAHLVMRKLSAPPIPMPGVTQRFNPERAALRKEKRAAGGQRQWKRNKHQATVGRTKELSS
jgi:hypothetical protein